MLVEFAPAKINLTLRVVSRRPDGYHDLESLVVFARPRDTLHFFPGEELSLATSGPTADAAGAANDNLVLRAARALKEAMPQVALGRFALRKVLPVAAGIGGGSSDAAAALRSLARTNEIAMTDPRLLSAAKKSGADVPVCLDPRPRMMRGVGDVLSAPLSLPELPAVLVNPLVAVPTAAVFAALAAIRAKDSPRKASPDPASTLAESGGKISADTLLDAVARSVNDLEGAAINVEPIIVDVIGALRALPGCKLARMSGSGATCFALFDRRDAAAAARQLKARHPTWWVRATILGAG